MLHPLREADTNATRSKVDLCGVLSRVSSVLEGRFDDHQENFPTEQFLGEFHPQ